LLNIITDNPIPQWLENNKKVTKEEVVFTGAIPVALKFTKS
jgi:hypothetical protein